MRWSSSVGSPIGFVEVSSKDTSSVNVHGGDASLVAVHVAAQCPAELRSAGVLLAARCPAELGSAGVLLAARRPAELGSTGVLQAARRPAESRSDAVRLAARRSTELDTDAVSVAARRSTELDTDFVPVAARRPAELDTDFVPVAGMCCGDASPGLSTEAASLPPGFPGHPSCLHDARPQRDRRPMAQRRGRVWRAATLSACLMLVYAWSAPLHAQNDPVRSGVDLTDEGSAVIDPQGVSPGAGVSPGDAAADEQLQSVLIELQELLRASRWSEALELVRTSELDAADALALRGFVLLQSNAPGPAREAFLGALDERPERLGIWLYVAQCSVALSDSSAALTAYERGLVAGRDVPAVWVLGAQIELQSGNLFRAWDVLTAAEQRFGDLPDARVLRVQVLSELGLRWTMLPWQLTHTQRASDACAWWAAAYAGDAAVGTPGQGLVHVAPNEGLSGVWQGSTGVWTALCDPILRQRGTFDAEHAVLQGGGDTSAGARLLRLAQSGECERALALASVYPEEVSAEAQPWLNWCASVE